MTNQEAVEVLSDIRSNYSCFDAGEEPKYHALSIAIEALKATQWILCSERLPEEGRYLVARHDDVTKTNFTDILWFEKNVWWNRQFTGNFAVFAWMPLPSPYKGEKL